jgi:hypothetical protein
MISKPFRKVKYKIAKILIIRYYREWGVETMRPDNGSIVFVIMAIFLYGVRKLFDIRRSFLGALSEHTVETKGLIVVREEISHFISRQCQVTIG